MIARTTPILVAVLAVAGCKDKEKDAPASNAPKVTPGSGSAGSATTPPTPTVTPPANGTPAIKLADGESFEGGDITSSAGTNPYAWKATPTETVAVAIVYKGETGRVVLAAPNGTPQELGTFEFNSAYSALYAFIPQADGSLVATFQSNGGSSDPGFVAAWKIRWDAANNAAIVADKGNWEGMSDEIPAWANLPDTE